MKLTVKLGKVPVSIELGAWDDVPVHHRTTVLATAGASLLYRRIGKDGVGKLAGVSTLSELLDAVAVKAAPVAAIDAAIETLVSKGLALPRRDKKAGWTWAMGIVIPNPAASKLRLWLAKHLPEDAQATTGADGKPVIPALTLAHVALAMANEKAERDAAADAALAGILADPPADAAPAPEGEASDDDGDDSAEPEGELSE